MSVAIKIVFFSVALMSTFASAKVLTTERMNIKIGLALWEDLEKLKVTSDKEYKTELSAESKKNHLNTEPNLVVFQNDFLTPDASKRDLKSSSINKNLIFNVTGSLKNEVHPDQFKCYVCNKVAEATCGMMNQGMPKEYIRRILVNKCRAFYKISEIKICISFVHDYFQEIVDMLVDRYYINEICPYLLGCLT